MAWNLTSPVLPVLIALATVAILAIPRRKPAPVRARRRNR